MKVATSLLIYHPCIVVKILFSIVSTLVSVHSN